MDSSNPLKLSTLTNFKTVKPNVVSVGRLVQRDFKNMYVTSVGVPLNGCR